MGALLDDTAFFHHDNEVGITDGGELVGDNEGGSTLHQLVDAALDQPLGLWIDVGRRFIEDEDFGVAQQGARKRDELTFTGREIRTALGDLLGDIGAAPHERAIESDAANGRL